MDALGALQSQSPGVNITQNNGFLGSGFKVNIRGIGTTGTFSPLYVVDGVANGSIDGLNPSDIESLDVLKDAASAAIYGARAANGVILITTKRGKRRCRSQLRRLCRRAEPLQNPYYPQCPRVHDDAG